jgi:ribonuclease HI
MSSTQNPPRLPDVPSGNQTTTATPATRGAVSGANQHPDIRGAPSGPNQHPHAHDAGTTTEHNASNKKRMRANITIATLNMNGLTAPTNGMTFLEKWAMINQTLNKYKIAIMALQETHLNLDTANRIRESFGRKMHIEYSCDPNAPRASAGVAFVLNKSLIAPSSIEAFELFPGRALAIKVKWLESETTTLLNIYAPVTRSEHKNFWNKIETERLSRRLAQPNFMLGDMNVTEDPIDRSPARADDQSATDPLRDIRQKWNVQDAWRLAYPDDKKFTYRANHNGQQIKSRLDRIYIAAPLIPLTFNWVTTQTPVPTDHWMVAVKYAPKDAPKIGKGRWTMPLYLLRNNTFIEKTVARGIKLQENLEEQNPEEGLGNPQQLWDSFKFDIQEIAKDILGSTHHRINTRIRRLEEDRDALANDPNADTDDSIRASEAIIVEQLEHLEKKLAGNKRDRLSAELALHGEKLGGIWSAISKEKKPRDTIRRLRIPGTNPPQYERDSEKMADLARKYHEDLQYNDLNLDLEDRELKINLILDEIPEKQTLNAADAAALDRPLTEAQLGKALQMAKNGSATGMDGCPYELWKTLRTQHERATKENRPSFDIIKAMTRVLADVQTNGIDKGSDFALGWMCPIYKKKDRTEISNYRPITLLNTDCKLLTKALAIQLMDHIRDLIHRDQAGFIPKRSIFDHIKLAEAIISYAEAAEVNGAIVALDQEKAYDKIHHKYLWKVLDAFNLPGTFINTVRTLYENATTQVAINGFLSEPFKITRGIRQGDPLSCAIFDLAIEPLACTIRKDTNLQGIRVPTLKEPLKAKFFADDTSVYLSETDKFDFLQMILDDWCQVSGAKFNIGKTEVVPIGTSAHREQVVSTRKLNQTDREPLSNQIRIASDGDAIRFLGAWIGNHTDVANPWEPVMDRIKLKLERWGTAHPTMKGRKTIIQAVIGGMTQFLTMAQGMPPNIEDALTKMIRKFMWADNSSPRLALEILQSSVEAGGLNLLDIKARNEAIEIMWLKAYLNFSPSRPEWANVIDLTIDAAAPPTSIPEARENPFLQSWKPATRGQRAKRLGADTIRMLKIASKHNTDLAAIRISSHLRAKLPAWYHIAADHRPITSATAKCLLRTHKALSVADLVKTSARIRNPNAVVNPPHYQITFCYCQDCSNDRYNGCQNPHACATEAQTRLEHITPKLNPLSPGNGHGNLSLTRRRKKQNETAKAQNGEILFDPSMTCKTDLAECFRIFIDPNRTSTEPARRTETRGTHLRIQEATVYTDGACTNNGKANAKCGSGIWFGPNHNKNKAFRVPGEAQSNQVGELVAIIVAIEDVPKNQPLKIITDSRYAIEGLTTHLGPWEDQGFIGIKHANLFKRAAFLLKKRSAKTSFMWTKGHAGDPGNEGSDQLAKEGAAKEEADILDLSIPEEFDLQGAKLATLSQSTAYKGIKERKKPRRRKQTDVNLKKTRAAIRDYNGLIETDETIWKGLQNPAFRIKVQQHLYKTMHKTQKIGEHWDHVPGHEEWRYCTTCQRTEDMEHIMTGCSARAREKIWQLAEAAWPHNHLPWPEITLGTILGCGSITSPREPAQDEGENQQQRRNYRGAMRLLQILISESAYLIWVLRCERVIQPRTHSETEIEKRWLRAINKRLIDDKITATKIKRGISHINLVKRTWEAVLRKDGELPEKWMHNREVLVGRGVRP